jgi:cell division protein ZapA (FtsZ GTPase activity inhibitor)
MKREKITVKLLNRQFDIETELDPLFVTQLVEYINSKAEEISCEQDTFDTIELLHNTLMALAEEIFILKEKKDNIENESNKKIDELILQVDSSLQV